MLVSCDGLCPWPVFPRYDCEAPDESDDAAESIDGLRGAVGRVSGRCGRDGGGMVTGDAGGEMPVDDRTGAETLRSWAYEDGFAGWFPPLAGMVGGVGGLACVGVAAFDLELASSAIRASSFSRGDRGPS